LDRIANRRLSRYTICIRLHYLVRYGLILGTYFQLRYQTLSGQWQLFAFDYGSSACVEYYEPPITIYATALAFDEPNRLLWMFGDSGFSSVISFAVKPFSGVLKVTNLTVPLEPGAFWLSPNKVHTFSRNSSRPYFYIVAGRPKQAAPVLTKIELFPPSSHVLLPVVGTVDWELDEERNLLVGAAVTPNANKLNITALDLRSLNSTSFSIAFGNGTLQTVHTSTIDTTQTRLFVGVITKELQYYIVTIDYALQRLMLATHVEEFLDDIRFLQFARNSK